MTSWIAVRRGSIGFAEDVTWANEGAAEIIVKRNREKVENGAHRLVKVMRKA